MRIVKGPDNPELDAAVGEDLAAQLRDELELVQGASHEFDQEAFLSGELTPVFFGTALGNFGVDHMLDGLVAGAGADAAQNRHPRSDGGGREIHRLRFQDPANMDPKHRDRVAFMRVVSGRYEKGMKLRRCAPAKTW